MTCVTCEVGNAYLSGKPDLTSFIFLMDVHVYISLFFRIWVWITIVVDTSVYFSLFSFSNVYFVTGTG